MFKSIAAISVAVLLTACVATTGINWNEETVSKLRQGMSKSEVLALFGDPTSQQKTTTGENLLFERPSDERGKGRRLYAVLTGEGMGLTNIDVLMVLLENGVVYDYSYVKR